VNVQFWFDPICPWCWVTSRWLTDVAEQRGFDVDWQPISLLFKNDPPTDSPYYEPVAWTRNLLRVVESARDGGHADRIGDLYTAMGTRIHDGTGSRDQFDVAPLLEEVGIPVEHAAAFDDESFDEVIRTRMKVGLDLTGDDVGTPIIAVDGPDGERVGLFGPVISTKPTGQAALDLWDGFLAMVAVPGFWELKRTRTVGPDLPVRD
jgi:hypothetical protein